MHSQVEENYLKALFTLSGSRGTVTVNELSRRLNIKMPTVTSMMKKLASKGLIEYERYKPIQLTEAGRTAAALILRKHRLTEMFLVEKMGFGWEEVHDIAEQIEHLNAPGFFTKMDELLNFPSFDPHGSPIPDRNGNIKPGGYIKLCECRAGDVAKVMAVADSSGEFLNFLNKREIKLGTVLTVQSTELFDHSMTVSFGDSLTETLSHTVCERLLVKKT